MIPYPYNMVDMGGIDLAEANGTVVEGLYAKIVEAVNACGDVVLYNWKFASIEIAPQHTQILVGENAAIINSVIQVTELDEVSIIGLDPPTPVGGIVPLQAVENRTYTAVSPVEGFNPVVVQVPLPDIPVLVPLTVSEPGTYIPSDYNADGFSEVIVTRAIRAAHVWTHSTGGTDASVYIQTGVIADGQFVPTSEVFDVRYSSVSNWTTYSIIQIRYGNWKVQGIVPIVFNDTTYQPGNLIVNWDYNISVDYLFVEAE